MTEPTVRHPISIEDATRLDPAQIAPPIVVTDGEHTEIGAAHGRVLPLIGHRRPYIYDVSLPDKRRVYADTPEDAIAVIIGGDYAEKLAALRDLESSIDDTAIDEAWLALASLRHAHADRLRLALQQQINDLAQRDGAWDHLDDEEQQQLTKAADSDGPYPVGVLEEIPFVDEEDNLCTRMAGVWSARVSLVLNTGDYDPYSNTPLPLSEMTRDGVVVPGDPNLVVLDIGDSAVYLESLEKAGWLTMSVLPAEQPDPIFRGINLS